MTLDEIRQNPEARASIAATLKDEWMMQALLALEQTIPIKVSMESEAIVSVRAQAREQGRRDMLQLLTGLVIAPEPPPNEPRQTFGSGLTPEQLEAAENHL